jgi:hypothetical protein
MATASVQISGGDDSYGPTTGTVGPGNCVIARWGGEEAGGKTRR